MKGNDAMAHGEPSEGEQAVARRLALADPSLLARLADIDIRGGEHFATEVALLAPGLRATLKTDGDPLGITSWASAPQANCVTMAVPGWWPIALRPDNGGAPLVEWGWFGTAAPRAPFYEEDARLARRHPLTQLLRPFSPLATIDSHRRRLPEALILHVSRCGSTLVAQMLAAMGRAHIMSEPPPFDAAIQSGDADLLRRMAMALGPDAADGPYVIKLDCWHACFPALLDAAFPGVPRIMLVRDPVEVIVSHQRSRGMQTVPGTAAASILGLDRHSGNDADDIAVSIGRVYAALADMIVRGRDLLIDWRALPEAVGARILPHIGITASAADYAAMRAASHRSAKAPHETYAPDSADKRAAASDAVYAAVARHIGPAWQQLTALID
jgi:hypothetical protein